MSPLRGSRIFFGLLLRVYTRGYFLAGLPALFMGRGVLRVGAVKWLRAGVAPAVGDGGLFLGRGCGVFAREIG